MNSPAEIIELMLEKRYKRPGWDTIVRVDPNGTDGYLLTVSQIRQDSDIVNAPFEQAKTLISKGLLKHSAYEAVRRAMRELDSVLLPLECARELIEHAAVAEADLFMEKKS